MPPWLLGALIGLGVAGLIILFTVWRRRRRETYVARTIKVALDGMVKRDVQ